MRGLDAADDLDHDVHVGPGREPHRVGREQVAGDAGTWVRQPPDGDAGHLELRAGPGGQFVGLLAQQPRDLRADDAAAQQRHLKRLAIWLQSSDVQSQQIVIVSRRTISRAAPSRTATTRRARQVVVVAGQGPAVRPGRGHREQVAGRRSAGRWQSLTTMSPLSQCRPTTRASIGGASEDRDASTQVYYASYSAVRMLSLIPPSTLT